MPSRSEGLLDVDVESADVSTWVLKHAILLYGSAGRTSDVAVRCPVTLDANGVPQLGAMRPLTPSFWRAAQARTRSRLPAGEFLTSDVLYRTPGRIVWWTPPSRRRLAYSDRQGEFSQLHGHEVSVPACVWRLDGGASLAVRAVAGPDRPVSDTRLALGPFWNTYADGSVCIGSMVVARKDAVGVIGQWVDAFFGSVFTHPNAHRGDLVRHPGGFFGAWLAARASAFDDAWLVPTNDTVASFATKAFKP